MTRADPERIYQAQGAGVFLRLVNAERLDRFGAKHYIARWERHAEAEGPARGSTGF